MHSHPVSPRLIKTLLGLPVLKQSAGMDCLGGKGVAGSLSPPFPNVRYAAAPATFSIWEVRLTIPHRTVTLRVSAPMACQSYLTSTHWR